MSPVRLSPEAVADLAEAAQWYAARRPGLEVEFLTEVERSAGESRRPMRPATRFPYAIVFVDLGTEIRILAVAHVKRRPGYWLNRLET